MKFAIFDSIFSFSSLLLLRLSRDFVQCSHSTQWDFFFFFFRKGRQKKINCTNRLQLLNCCTLSFLSSILGLFRNELLHSSKWKMYYAQVMFIVSLAMRKMKNVRQWNDSINGKNAKRTSNWGENCRFKKRSLKASAAVEISGREEVIFCWNVIKDARASTLLRENEQENGVSMRERFIRHNRIIFTLIFFSPFHFSFRNYFSHHFSCSSILACCWACTIFMIWLLRNEHFFPFHLILITYCECANSHTCHCRSVRQIQCRRGE